MNWIKEAAAVIQKGGLAAFPTETVYGLGADAMNPEASKKIYGVKGRPSDNPLIVHIAEFSDFLCIADQLPDAASELAKAFWPGPLTMVVKKNEKVPDETTGGLDTVAVRMPSHPIALELIRESSCLIAAPSANSSGRPSPTLASHVIEDLGGKIPIILDGGKVGIGIESAIIDLTEQTPVILRPGSITKDMLQDVIGTVRIDPGIAENSSIQPKAPGMKYRHYAPKAGLLVIGGKRDGVIAEINKRIEGLQAEGKRAGVIAADETAEEYRGDIVLSIGKREEEEIIARNLYGILRQFDESGVDMIYSESFAAPGMGQAIMNRLLKAAGQQMLVV